MLLDTGAFVALVDRSERRHADCVAVLDRWSGPVVTTEAVLTETLHLVGPRWRAQDACLEFVLRGAFVLVPASLESLRRVATLMEAYSDVPMDYADATLVALGEELNTSRVFTLDRRGFSAYRLRRRKPFELLP
ncbi:MAG: PIN domain-containing protein [Burkholderiales bacterium]|nr:PIN domain-containing protein [Burkholderiales bacterium]